MNKGLAIAGGLGLGAALMYVLDPDRGGRRRALFRDRVASAAHDVEGAAGRTARDVRNRSYGLAAGLKSHFTSEPATDEVIHDRVRSVMGRYVSHPGAIDVTVRNGRVTLAGPVLSHEVLDLLDCVARVRDVQEVENQLEPHADAGNIPSLQGGKERPGERFELFQEHWSPTARLLVGAAGGALALYGASRRDIVGGAIGAIGIAVLARGAANTGAADLFGVHPGRHEVEVRRAITVDAPVDQVFDFWRKLENLPRFMSNVEHVRDLGDGRSHWRVKGPGGVPVEWDARITREEPNYLIAWESDPGSVVESHAEVRVVPGLRGGTRIEVRMSYTPPAGATGQGVSALVSAHPKRELNADLQRMKAIIEEGRGRDATLH